MAANTENSEDIWNGIEDNNSWPYQNEICLTSSSQETQNTRNISLHQEPSVGNSRQRSHVHQDYFDEKNASTFRLHRNTSAKNNPAMHPDSVYQREQTNLSGKYDYNIDANEHMVNSFHKPATQSYKNASSFHKGRFDEDSVTSYGSFRGSNPSCSVTRQKFEDYQNQTSSTGFVDYNSSGIGKFENHIHNPNRFNNENSAALHDIVDDETVNSFNSHTSYRSTYSGMWPNVSKKVRSIRSPKKTCHDGNSYSTFEENFQFPKKFTDRGNEIVSPSNEFIFDEASVTSHASHMSFGSTKAEMELQNRAVRNNSIQSEINSFETDAFGSSGNFFQKSSSPRQSARREIHEQPIYEETSDDDTVTSQTSHMSYGSNYSGIGHKLNQARSNPMQSMVNENHANMFRTDKNYYQNPTSPSNRSENHFATSPVFEDIFDDTTVTSLKSHMGFGTTYPGMRSKPKLRRRSMSSSNEYGSDFFRKPEDVRWSRYQFTQGADMPEDVLDDASVKSHSSHVSYGSTHSGMQHKKHNARRRRSISSTNSIFADRRSSKNHASHSQSVDFNAFTRPILEDIFDDTTVTSHKSHIGFGSVHSSMQLKPQPRRRSLSSSNEYGSEVFRKSHDLNNNTFKDISYGADVPTSQLLQDVFDDHIVNSHASCNGYESKVPCQPHQKAANGRNANSSGVQDFHANTQWKTIDNFHYGNESSNIHGSNDGFANEHSLYERENNNTSQRSHSAHFRAGQERGKISGNPSTIMQNMRPYYANATYTHLEFPKHSVRLTKSNVQTYESSQSSNTMGTAVSSCPEMKKSQQSPPKKSKDKKFVQSLRISTGSNYSAKSKVILEHPVKSLKIGDKISNVRAKAGASLQSVKHLRQTKEPDRFSEIHYGSMDTNFSCDTDGTQNSNQYSPTKAKDKLLRSLDTIQEQNVSEKPYKGKKIGQNRLKSKKGSKAEKGKQKKSFSFFTCSLVPAMFSKSEKIKSIDSNSTDEMSASCDSATFDSSNMSASHTTISDSYANRKQRAIQALSFSRAPNHLSRSNMNSVNQARQSHFHMHNKARLATKNPPLYYNDLISTSQFKHQEQYPKSTNTHSYSSSMNSSPKKDVSIITPQTNTFDVSDDESVETYNSQLMMKKNFSKFSEYRARGWQASKNNQIRFQGFDNTRDMYSEQRDSSEGITRKDNIEHEREGNQVRRREDPQNIW